MATVERDAADIGKLLEGIDIAMLTTIGKGGYLVSRPLSTQAAAFDGEKLWFFTEADSPKIGEIRRHPKVNVAYSSKEKNTYVSLAGDAAINRDRALVELFWNDALKAFFPKGKDDPNLALLEVTVRTIEYWDGPGTLIGKLVGFVVARVTKREEAMGTNRIVDLTGARKTSRLPPSHADARPARGKAGKKIGAKSAVTKKATPSAAKKAAKKTVKKAPAKRAKPAVAARKTTTKKTAAETVRKAPAKAAKAAKARRR